MMMLWASAATFLGIHLFSARMRLRDLVTNAIGETIYIVVFSLVSAAVLVWLWFAYNAARVSAENRVLYDLGSRVRDAALPIVLLAFLIGVPGLLLRKSPTRIGYQNTAPSPNSVMGIIAITRHPFLWGFTIWSGFHLAANGDEASVILFGSLFLLSLFGTVSIDAKRKRKLGADWDAFAAHTSNIPFAAILAGRVKPNWREIFGWPMAVAFLLFLLFLFGHARMTGISPFPDGWRFS
jgi:uncharacterized membrane protein